MNMCVWPIVLCLYCFALFYVHVHVHVLVCVCMHVLLFVVCKANIFGQCSSMIYPLSQLVDFQCKWEETNEQHMCAKTLND